jgi:hypothetical protein
MPIRQHFMPVDARRPGIPGVPHPVSMHVRETYSGPSPVVRPAAYESPFASLDKERERERVPPLHGQQVKEEVKIGAWTVQAASAQPPRSPVAHGHEVS